MKWQEVIDDKSLRDLPYKIELNEYGCILMSPASNLHGWLQGQVLYLLRMGIAFGTVLTECSVQTDKGVKVADVAWCSKEFLKQHGLETPYTRAPEICVEIVSPSNGAVEMEEKRRLYFSQGAEEVWMVSEAGEIEIYTPVGRVAASAYVGRMDPIKIEFH
ncbi:MAG: Uma2 family endonuclease [Gammaproteobacteria bacterium]|nr:Uma2 family endonuclease [Gammaproteobacteria bacterium]MBU1654347.1 Uma2 family endonuclease [Gammaproteobacteria bacterium]MBU1962665.1 Uma2 family endonuclease [Gammaproteobacteria bacterium]